MKKTILSILSAVIAVSFPAVAHALTGSWSYDSTTTPQFYPTPVFGAYASVRSPNFAATSSTATSTFAGDISSTAHIFVKPGANFLSNPAIQLTGVSGTNVGGLSPSFTSGSFMAVTQANSFTTAIENFLFNSLDDQFFVPITAGGGAAGAAWIATTTPLTAPPYSFNGDLSTGISDPNSNGFVAVSNLGIPTAVFSPANNFGVGSTSPSRRLTVGGDSYLGGNVTATGTLALLPLAAPAGSFLAVDPSGNVIPTTTPSSGVVAGSPNTPSGFNSSGALVSTSSPAFAYFTATSTNATSTFAGGVVFASTTATTTAADGFNLSSGCYAINGACVTGGGASLTGGSPNTLTYWTSPTAVSATGSPTVGYVTATSTSIASTLPLASTTDISASSSVALAYGGGNVTVGGIDPSGARLQIHGAGGVAFIDAQPTTNTTGAAYTQVNNAGGGSYYGVNDSSGAFNGIVGAKPYASFFGSYNMTDFDMISQNAVRLVGTAGGLLGFGSTTPAYAFSFEAPATTSPVLVIASSTNAAQVALLANGNLGIGTIAPSTALTVVGTTTSTGFADTNYKNAIASFDQNGNLVGTTTGGSGSGTVNSGLAGQAAYYQANGTAVSGTSSLFFLPNGYVGIGTTTPTSTLAVQGVSQFSYPATTTQYVLPPPAPNRNDFTGVVGVQFTVSRPVTVTAMGRLYVSGNVQNHNVALWQLGNTASPLASTTVNLSSPSDANGFKYGSIAPFTLVPGVTYLVAVNETSGNDLWTNTWQPVTQSFYQDVQGVYNGTVDTYPGSVFGSQETLDTPAFLFAPATTTVSGDNITTSNLTVNTIVQASSTQMAMVGQTGSSTIYFNPNGSGVGIGGSAVHALDVYGTAKFNPENTGGGTTTEQLWSNASSNVGWAVCLGSQAIPNIYIGGTSCTEAQSFWQANWNQSNVAENTFRVASGATNIQTLNAEAIPGQTGDVFDVSSSTKVIGSLFNVTAGGFVGVASTSPSYPLSMSSSTNSLVGLFSVDSNGDQIGGGAKPSVACASTCTLDPHAHDSSGIIYLSGSQTTVTLTFAAAKPWAPHCTVSDNSTTGVYTSSSTPTQLVMTTGLSLGAASISYSCPM